MTFASILDRLRTESAECLRAFGLHITSLVHLPKTIWKLRTNRKSRMDAKVSIGAKAVELGLAPAEMAEQLASLSERVLNLKAINESTSKLEAERRGLLVRIANHVLSLQSGDLPSSLSGPIAELAAIQETEKCLTDELSQATRGTLQSTLQQRLHIVASYSLCVCFVWVLTHSNNTTTTTQLAGNSRPSNSSAPSANDQLDESPQITPASLKQLEPTVSVAAPVAEIPKLQIKYPEAVWRFDLTTPDDALYTHLVERFTDSGECSTWPLFKMAHKQLSGIIGNVLDSQVIANTVTTSFRVDGQQATKEIEDLVADCARILNIPKPAVYLRDDPHANAYSTGFESPYVIVITSGLLKVYADTHEELRFVVGHELGHIKCRHMKLQAAGNAALLGLAAVDDKVFSKLNILPPLGLGYLLSWSRQAELTADRAGLLCCQDFKIAAQALARLKHGLNKNNSWLSRDNPDVDIDQMISAFRAYENRPLVDFLIDRKRSSSTHPFIEDRLAHLQYWHKSGELDRLLAREKSQLERFKLRIDLILVRNLATGSDTADPYLRIIDASGALLRETPPVAKVQSAAWKNIDAELDLERGQPFFIEIWDDDYGPDSLIGLITVFPKKGQVVYETNIKWDVDERKSVSRIGQASVKIQEVQ
ncbi:MAG: Zn-dependent protease with chaperone function [Planctomycetota bacterium]|nr:MAG: Zn-dependent protease with chaperone function [Planctomycetota bacterium]